MSLYVGTGTITTDTSGDPVVCRGWSTLSAHLDSGSGVLTWEFKGPDGVWRTIYAGSDNATAQSYSATHMLNVFFGGDVVVRCTGSSGSSPQWDWQIIGNVSNRYA